MHYKAVSKLKPRLLSFIYLFIFFCQKLHRAAEDHSELASICHDEGPGTLALPRLPPQHSRTLSSSAPTQPHYTETFYFALPNCRSPLVWLQHTLIFILGRAVALVLAGVRPLLPASFMPHYKSGMKSEWSCCLSALKLFAAKSKCGFHSAVVTQTVCLNLILWTFPPCNSIHYIDKKRCRGGSTLKRVYVVYSIRYLTCLLFVKELFSILYFLWQHPHS